MKLRAKVVLFLFGILYLIIGIFMVLYSAGIIEAKDLNFLTLRIQELIPFKILIGVVGGVLIILVITLLNFVWSGLEAERNVAFRTEYGEVMVSLSAIEDYIRKLLRQDLDIRDIRTKVSARKRGLLILLKAVIVSESNIPAITERIQSQIKTKIQEMLGMEEPVTIRVYISKIGEKEKKKGSKDEGGGRSEETLPPYREF